jgi:protein TonB
VQTYVAPVVEEEEDIDVNFVYSMAGLEKMPEFPGGDAALLKWINENMKYPTIAQEQGIFGTVYCQFVVEPDGSVTNVEVTRGQDISLDRESVRVLRMLPKFTPGEQRGRPVRVRYSVPIRFRLQ